MNFSKSAFLVFFFRMTPQLFAMETPAAAAAEEGAGDESGGRMRLGGGHHSRGDGGGPSLSFFDLGNNDHGHDKPAANPVSVRTMSGV